jgi:NTE family protein/lysophospholipid hydrolase
MNQAFSGLDPELLALVSATPPFDRLPVAVREALCGRMTRLELAAGETLFERGDGGDALYLVIDGRLQAHVVSAEGSPARSTAFGPGETVGEMQLLIGGQREARVRAVSATRLAQLAKPAFDELAAAAPELVVMLGELIRRTLREEQLARVLADVFGELEHAALRRIQNELQWVELHAGEALFEQGQPSDCMYLVVSGRLVGVRDTGAERRIVAEIGRGESIGEMGFFTGEPRSLGIYARRTSHLVRLERPMFDRLSHDHPRAMLYITQLLIKRLQRASGFVRESFDRVNLVVLPISAGAGGAQFTARSAEFTERLVEALRTHGETLYVNGARLDAFLGVPGFAQTPSESPLDLALNAGLDDRESSYRYAVYECDASDTAWTRRCIERADRILLLGDAQSDPGETATERAMLGAKFGDYRDLIAARRTLVLAHPPSTELPSGTRYWLAPRQLDSHHHLRWDRDADFARLARFLTGNAIGAVLGGGGARGFAHLGAIRALREAGIPIDLIGGTSMGALIGIQPALGWSDEAMLEANRRSFVEKKPVGFLDYTVPVYSLVDGARLDRSLMDPLGETRIEDLWTGYFCVSSNLTRAEPKVHREGPVWKAIRASLSLPCVFQPVIDGTDLLVDGGVLNNLPGDVMRDLGGGWVIAVDVSLGKDLEVHGARLPSPWRVLADWVNPFAQRVDRPNIVNLVMRATVLSSVRKTEAVKKLVDLYIQPPVNRFGLMEFRSLEEIAEAGYAHTRKALAEWIAQRPDIARMLRMEQGERATVQA